MMGPMSIQTATAAPALQASVQSLVSRNIKLLLVAADWDQGDLANAVGLSEPQVSRKMKNKGSSWTLDDLAHVAGAFSRQLTFTVEPGAFFRPIEETIGQNWKKMNASDLEVIDGGDEGGQQRFGHLHLVT